jgi:hypothetical protein
MCGGHESNSPDPQRRRVYMHQRCTYSDLITYNVLHACVLSWSYVQQPAALPAPS